MESKASQQYYILSGLFNSIKSILIIKDLVEVSYYPRCERCTALMMKVCVTYFNGLCKASKVWRIIFSEEQLTNLQELL